MPVQDQAQAQDAQIQWITPEWVGNVFWGGENFDPTQFEPITEVSSVKVEETPAVESVPVETAEAIIPEWADERTPVENIEVDTVSSGKKWNIISKFISLFETAKEIDDLSDLKDDHWTLIGGKTADESIEYHVYLIQEWFDQEIFIKKIITNTKNNTETEYMLQFTYDTQKKGLEVFVNENSLFTVREDESEIWHDASLIKEKIEKFSFLFTSRLEELKKAQEEKKRIEAKKHQLQDVFRNF